MVQTNYRPSADAILNPCADPIFKSLFTDESKEAHKALTSFLCDIIGRNVTDVVLQPNELSVESISDKQSEFDINCKIDGKIANIEMQGENHGENYAKRAEYHVAHLLNHYTPKGTPWEKIPQVYQISVMNFNFDKDSRNSINHYILKNEEGRPLSKSLNVIFMELPKIARLTDDISRLTNAQMWGKFFLYASNPEKKDYINQLIQTNGGIKMAFTVLKNISQDELNWYHESRYWMHVSDELTMKNAARKEGLKEGLKEGANQKAFETAKKLLEMKVLTKEQISQATGLTIQEIEQINSTK